ncbi:MAG: hypothetical protein JWM80_4324 [Cyanobacteria bacterium RYN_339]|nr:hypothetical protein [Cyanobacteria bacterium RYN_339]
MRIVAAALVLATSIAFQAPRVTPAAVAERQDGGETLVLVDTRSRASYDREHIAGAVSLPGNVLERSAQGLPKNKTLVLYCTCAGEHGALDAARKLHDNWGYSKLVVLEGGMDAWREAGYEMVVHHPTPQPTAKPTPTPTPVATNKPDKF